MIRDGVNRAWQASVVVLSRYADSILRLYHPDRVLVNTHHHLVRLHSLHFVLRYLISFLANLNGGMCHLQCRVKDLKRVWGILAG